MNPPTRGVHRSLNASPNKTVSLGKPARDVVIVDKPKEMKQHNLHTGSTEAGSRQRRCEAQTSPQNPLPPKAVFNFFGYRFIGLRIGV